MWVFAVIAALPVVEIMLFMTVGVWLGLWLTLALILGSGVLGWQIIRQEGVGSLRALQVAAAPDDPLTPLADRAMLVVAGVLLILPGFFSDAVGLLLLLPPVQAMAAAALGRRMHFSRPGQREEAVILEGDYTEVTPPRQDGPSGWTRPD